MAYDEDIGDVKIFPRTTIGRFHGARVSMNGNAKRGKDVNPLFVQRHGAELPFYREG